MTAKKLSGFDVDEAHIAVTANGYVVELPLDEPWDLHVFVSWQGVTDFLFTHLTKPEGGVTN